MKDFKLTGSLRSHFLNLSNTIQVLIGDIVLAVEGMHHEAVRREEARYDQAARARRANELSNDRLREYLAEHKIDTTDATIGQCTVSGRSTHETAEFLGLEYRFVMRRLCALRKDVAKWKPAIRHEPAPHSADVLELFAEAQRR
jgi:hypothetical protein